MEPQRILSRPNRPTVHLTSIFIREDMESGAKSDGNMPWGDSALDEMKKKEIDGLVVIKIETDCRKLTDYYRDEKGAFRETFSEDFPMAHECGVNPHDDCWGTHYYYVPFVRGATRNRDMPYTKQDGSTGHWHDIAWGWDGNKEAPTLNPSFLSETDYTTWMQRFHIFFRDGRIELLSDSAITLKDGSVVPMMLA